MTGESRKELIQWLNSLLGLSYERVEECGTGVAYCLVLDSIYEDIPLMKLNMNPKHEYEYISNFKVLQSVLSQKNIRCNATVDKLVKCRLQDNLEFLQWIKKVEVTYEILLVRFWDRNFPKDKVYNLPARLELRDYKSRRASEVWNCASSRGARISSNSRGAAHENRKGQTMASVQSSRGSSFTGKCGISTVQNTRCTNTASDDCASNEKPKEEDDSYKQIVYYYSKLCSIENIIHEYMNNKDVRSPVESLEEIKRVLYETEEGFEVPQVLEEQVNIA